MPCTCQSLVLFSMEPSVGHQISPEHLHLPCRACSFIEHSELEQIHKDHPVQLLALHRHPNNPTTCLSVLSKRSLGSVSPGAMTFPWRACSVPDHLLREEPFPDIQPKSPLTQLQPFPRVPSLVTREKSPLPDLVYPVSACVLHNSLTPFLSTNDAQY